MLLEIVLWAFGLNVQPDLSKFNLIIDDCAFIPHQHVERISLIPKALEYFLSIA